MNQHGQPDWSKRLPGEQWLVLDSIQTAEIYLKALPSSFSIQREIYPNEAGLYAQFLPPGQVLKNRIYVPITE